MAEDTSTLTDALAQILPNRHRSELLDAIDTLRHFNKKGLDLPVPQLVVLGDQSSGKSSVLESVARISLPVGTGLCTRFPIELALRNGSSDSMEMEILPGDSREQSDMSTHELKNFRRSATNLGNMDVSGWIQDAAETIGVVPENGFSERGGSRGYSDDVVRIVRRGPQMVDLTLIDLPGLFQSPTETQSAEDKSKVKKIILKYAENPNSLILLVCSAHNDFSVNGTPSVLRGRFRDRTMGILTRSDSENGTKNHEAHPRRSKNACRAWLALSYQSIRRVLFSQELTDLQVKTIEKCRSKRKLRPGTPIYRRSCGQHIRPQLPSI